MSRTVVNRQELELAFEFVSFGRPMEHEAYLCLDTGELHWHSEIGDNEEELPEDVDDPEKYLAIPHKNDLDLGTRLVLRFAAEQLPDAYDKVEAIFSRPGAYGRLKELLDQRGMLEQWYQYEEQAQQAALRDWCEANGIEVQG